MLRQSRPDRPGCRSGYRVARSGPAYPSAQPGRPQYRQRYRSGRGARFPDQCFHCLQRSIRPPRSGCSRPGRHAFAPAIRSVRAHSAASFAAISRGIGPSERCWTPISGPKPTSERETRVISSAIPCSDLAIRPVSGIIPLSVEDVAANSTGAPGSPPITLGKIKVAN